MIVYQLESLHQKQIIFHFDFHLFYSRPKLNDQQQHQHNQEQPTAQIVPHISDIAPTWHFNATTCRCTIARPQHRETVESCAKLRMWADKWFLREKRAAASSYPFVIFCVINPLYQYQIPRMSKSSQQELALTWECQHNMQGIDISSKASNRDYVFWIIIDREKHFWSRWVH